MFRLFTFSYRTMKIIKHVQDLRGTNLKIGNVLPTYVYTFAYSCVDLRCVCRFRGFVWGGPDKEQHDLGNA